jgi:cytochrome c551/c552
LNAQAIAGKVVFTRECAACHSLLADTIIVGPSMKGIAGQAGARVADQDARAYLLSSIIDPGGYVLEGYQNLMPTNFGTRLTGEEIDALVAFMLTLE